MAPAVPNAVSADYNRNVLTLLKLTVAKDASGNPAPHVLKLEQEAHDGMRDLNAGWSRRTRRIRRIRKHRRLGR